MCGASLLKAFEGGNVWKGDVLFMSAACCWGAYSVTVRRLALDPVRATMAITAFAFVVYVPCYVLALVTAGILFGVRQARAPALQKVTP